MASTAGSSDIARRYATAFFALAREQEKIDEIADDLAALAGILAESDELSRVLGNPLLSRREQINVMTELCKKAKLSKLTSNFVGTIAQNRRLPILSQIIRALQGEIASHRGEVTAEVTTATKLNKTQAKAIEDALKKALGSGVQLDIKEDPEILGGLIVKVGSRMIDDSVQTKLQRLHRAMKSQSAAEEQEKMKEVA